MPTTDDTTLNESAGLFTRIDQSDININPFYAYKKWTVSSGSATSSAMPLTAIYSDINQLSLIGINNNDPKNINNSLQSITYFSINHLFYKRKNTYYTFGYDDITRSKKFLYQSASIFSFPGSKVGLGIKPTSFTYTNSSCSLKDDRYGNVYDTNIDTSSLIDNVMYYEGFNEYFDTSRIKPLTMQLFPEVSPIYQNVTFVPGITLTGSYVPTPSNIGLAARFAGNGYMIQDINGSYDRDHDFAISFFISASTQSAGSKLILGKANQYQLQYPFKIELTADAKVKFSSAADASVSGFITSSVLNSGWQHVVCQKSGSKMYLHVNNGIPVTASNPAYLKPSYENSGADYINNYSPLYIGGFDANTSNITADLDEIRIFNKALSTSNISALNNRTITGSLLQTNVVGNVFHDQGIVVISSPNPIYNNIINRPYSASYRSTVKLYELSVMARVPSDRYNMSLNKSLTLDDGETYDSYVSGSDFSPYITSIGLYNEFNQLLAIAKLAQPIKKRNDLDLNFLIRIDSDQPWNMGITNQSVTGVITDSTDPIGTVDPNASGGGPGDPNVMSS